MVLTKDILIGLRTLSNQTNIKKEVWVIMQQPVINLKIIEA